MTRAVNPFRPNSPVHPDMFMGRREQVSAMEASLAQTRAGQPKNFMLTGERGIGKTSLLDYIRYFASGAFDIEGERFNFLVVHTDIEPSTTPFGLVKKVELALRLKLQQVEKLRSFLKTCWEFVSRIEAAGVSFHGDSSQDNDLLLEQFAYSVAETANRICSPGHYDSEGNRFDGILILLDECDNASSELGLGAFLKLLLERVQRNNCERLMVGIAGLNLLRSKLMDSHPSALRLFDETPLSRLTPHDARKVIERCLSRAEEANGERVAITDEAQAVLVDLSEGFPHFLQQLGYCAFETDSDSNIDRQDVIDGAMGPNGAITLIGDRYYRDDFYGRIQKDSYRQVLRIMAEKLDAWTRKNEIREHFNGKDTTLDSAIKALRERRIILSKPGTRGVYRLENKAFALWIKFCTVDPSLWTKDIDV